MCIRDRIEDSTVDEGTTVNASQVYGSHLGPHNNIGPFTHVRVNTVTDYGDVYKRQYPGRRSFCRAI